MLSYLKLNKKESFKEWKLPISTKTRFMNLCCLRPIVDFVQRWRSFRRMRT